MKMIVHPRGWLLLSLSSNINEVQGFFPFHVHLLVVWAFLLPFKSLEIRPSLIHFAGSRTQHFSGKSLSFVKLFSLL